MCIDENELVRLQQPREHRRHFFAAIRGARYSGDFGDVTGVSHCYSSEALHPFSDLIYKCDLLAGVLIKQEMQLVECPAAHKPVVLLVECVENLCIAKELIQALT